MVLKIIEKIKYIYINYLFFINIYFTLYPQILYYNSTNNGNMSLAGVGLGLIYSQRMFWISNLSICMITFYKYNNNENIKSQYIIIFLYFIPLSMYILSMLKTIHLIKYLKI